MPVHKTVLVALPVVIAVVCPAAPATAYPRPGITERVSVASDGTEGDGYSGGSGWSGNPMSADARFVAFESSASNLVPGDGNSAPDVFVRDRAARTTERVSVDSGGTEADGPSGTPSMSLDGRFVAFESEATNLGGSGGGFPPDIYLHDRETGTTVHLGKGWRPSVAGDGGVVAWDTLADIKVWDRETGKVTVADVASDGTPGWAVAQEASVSADGRYVAFASSSDNLDREDPDITSDIFVHDRLTGKTDLASISSEGQKGNRPSMQPAISGDGRYVAFWSYAMNMVPNQKTDLQMFVHDRITERIELVSVGTDGRAGDWWAWGRPALSHDGRYVAFRGGSENLVANDGNGTWDVFVHDRLTGSTELASANVEGRAGPSGSYAPSITPDGRYVSFTSAADDLISEFDINGVSDVFVRDRGPAIGVGEMDAGLVGGEIAVEGWAGLSGVVVSSAVDDASDGRAGNRIGAEITRASLTYRPEEGDLLVRVMLKELLGVRSQQQFGFITPGVAGLPGGLYGFELRVKGIRYELRISGVTEPASPTAPRIALFRCDPGCVEVSRPRGGLGVTGPELRVAIPLSAVGGSEGAALTGVRAFTAVGEVETGVQQPLDDVGLPGATIPETRVHLGLAHEGTPAEQVAYGGEGALAAGSFSGAVPMDDRPPGPYQVWARVCLGAQCGTASRPVTLG